MCNIGFQFKQNDAYKFIFAANRDEAYKRPTRAAHFWPEHPELLAGQDGVQKGTWLGITKQGKFAALTNCRRFSSGEDRPETKYFATSRGTLVKNFLVGQQSAPEYAAELSATHEQYDGYNLIFGNISEGRFFHYNNFDNQFTEISPGTHGLSNATLNTPWPKVQKVTSEMKQIAGKKEQISEQLFTLFADKETAPRELLPNTGIPRDLEEAVSAVFIRTPEYGTVGTTVVLVDQQNQVTFVERRFDQNGQIEEKTFEFFLDV